MTEPDLTGDERALLARMLTSHAYRERLAADRYRAALALAPTAADRAYLARVIEEEEDHYGGCIDVGHHLGIDIAERVAERAGRLPAGIPELHDWLDVTLAHALNDQAGYQVMVGLRGSRIIAYAKMAEQILSEEADHGQTGAVAAARTYRTTDLSPELLRERLVIHLDAAVRCLGRPGSAGDRAALAAGFKMRSAADTIRAFCADADSVLAALDEPTLLPAAARYLSTT
jgi:1,2-phenylacetyl-CoA epoxidase catalytic subunit